MTGVVVFLRPADRVPPWLSAHAAVASARLAVVSVHLLSPVGRRLRRLAVEQTGGDDQ